MLKFLQLQFVEHSFKVAGFTVVMQFATRFSPFRVFPFGSILSVCDLGEGPLGDNTLHDLFDIPVVPCMHQATVTAKATVLDVNFRGNQEC